MSLFGSIFGEKGFGKGSHDVAFTAGAGARGMRPGRSGAFFFCPAAPKFFGRAARPENEHNIGGAHPRALSPRRWKTPSGMSPQSGRSMIEMLAVLAIIGVLTVGGIAAYSFAVTKHRANQIYNQVDLRAVTAFSNPIVRQTQIGNTFFLPGFDDTFENMPYEHSKIGYAAFQIKVTNVPQKVCRRLQDMTFKLPRQVTLNGEDVSSACGAQNTFVFVYDGLSVGKPSSGVTPIDCDCSGCQSCESGTCQDNDNLCGPKEVCVSGRCQCASDYTECRGGCYTACGDGLMRDPISCDCVCEPQECPAFAQWDETSCSCQCEDGYEMCGGTCHPACTGSGMTGSRDPETCACTCIEGTNAETCACPAGYIYINGQCQRFECKGGPTNFDCYINDQKCGYNCDSLGRNCSYGICYADECTSDEWFTVAPKNSYSCQYACARELNNVPCYMYQRSEGYKCYRNETMCMSLNPSLVQIRGTCDPEFCSSVSASSTFTYWGEGGIIYGACDFGDNLVCYPTNDYTKWACHKNGYLCGSGCTDPFNCLNCSSSACVNGMTYNAQTGYCEDPDTGVYCTATDGAFYQQCYLPNGEACATIMYDGIISSGSCEDPGCSEGFEFRQVIGNYYYGCLNENTNVSCYYNISHPPAICYYGSVLCGERCQYDGTGCGSVYLPQCALTGHCPQTGYNMSDGCTCDGSVTSRNGVSYCCPSGHTYTNGGCTLVTCAAGQIADENGICKEVCENNAQITSTCVCGGTTHTNQFNAEICCDTDHAWNETTQTCQ